MMDMRGVRVGRLFQDQPVARLPKFAIRSLLLASQLSCCTVG